MFLYKDMSTSGRNFIDEVTELVEKSNISFLGVWGVESEADMHIKLNFSLYDFTFRFYCEYVYSGSYSISIESMKVMKAGQPFKDLEYRKNMRQTFFDLLIGLNESGNSHNYLRYKGSLYTPYEETYNYLNTKKGQYENL